MKPLYKVLILIGAVLLYFIFAYGWFYLYIGRNSLKSPFTNDTLEIVGDGTATKIKYVALGDSLTAGVGSNDVLDTYVYAVGESLIGEGNDVVIKNFGIPGGRTDEIIKYEIPQAVAENPDYVTLLVGINDIHDKSTVKRFKSQLNTIINTLLDQTQAKIYVLSIPYLGAAPAMLPPFNFFMQERTKAFNKAILDTVNTFSSPRIHYIDLYSTTLYFAKHEKKYYSSDYYHPSNYGYGLWKQVLNVN